MIPKLLTTTLAGLLLATTLSARQMGTADPIDLSLVEADVAETLRAFARISGAEVDIDPTVEGTVTVAIESMPWDEAMEMICRLAELRCTIEDTTPPLLRVRPMAETEEDGEVAAISLDLRKAELRETLIAFGAISGRKVTIHPDVGGTVTLTVDGVPWPQVLAMVCHLNDCRATIDDGHIAIAPDQRQPETRLDLDAEETPLADVLRTFEQQPLLGDGLFLTLDLAPALGDRPITLELDDTPWGEAMVALCAQAGCSWKVLPGQPPVLAVVPSDPNLERPISFSVRHSPLRGVAEGLAALVDLKVFVPPTLGPDQLVDLEARDVPWRTAMDRLCLQVGCSWEVRGARLVLRPQVRALMVQPPAGSRAPGLLVRTFAGDAALPVKRTVRFTWTRPVATVPLGDDNPHHLLLTWIPFTPAHHVVVPSLAPCTAAAGALRAQRLETVSLPLPTPWTTTWHGAVVELVPLGDGERSAEETRPTPPCTTDLGVRLAASFRPAGQGTAVESQELPMHLGRYLLISPPPTPRAPNPQPAAALVFLGTAPGGGQTVALVRPAAAGGAAVETLTLEEDESRTVQLQTPAGGLALALRLVVPAS